MRAEGEEMTPDILHKMFEYQKGVLYRKTSNTNRVKAGSPVGSLHRTGYMMTKIAGKSWAVHRIIYMLHYGELPGFIDHIDGDRRNNHIENLRPATIAENCRNCKLPRDNTSGIKGVSWHRSARKWQAAVRVDGKLHYLGVFSLKTMAEKAAKTFRQEYHGVFANHGKDA